MNARALLDALMGVNADIARQVEEFAASVHVHARFGETEGILELTDLFADEPGSGGGTQVMTRLGELCDEHDVVCVTHPSSARNKVFYKRFHFESVTWMGTRLMMRHPASQRFDPDDYDPDDYPEGFNPFAQDDE